MLCTGGLYIPDAAVAATNNKSAKMFFFFFYQTASLFSFSPLSIPNNPRHLCPQERV
jgi:hypothetical protein